MRKIGYTVGGSIMRAHDAAYVTDDESVVETLVESVIATISTGVEVKIGDVSIHLAALLDPDHWEEDWRARGVEDVDAWAAAHLEDAQS